MQSEVQQARALLRERFLRLISQVSCDQNCRLKFYGNDEHVCNIRAINPNLETLIVEDLKTNYPDPIPKAIIRMNDIISIHIENSNLVKLK